MSRGRHQPSSDWVPTALKSVKMATFLSGPPPSHWGSVSNRICSDEHERVGHFQPSVGRVDRAFATETRASGSIPGRVKPKTRKMVLTASLFDL